MTTAAPRATPQELDELAREAWTAYRDGLRDLEGREYDAAEERSWDALQGTLGEIEIRRTGGSGAGRESEPEG